MWSWSREAEERSGQLARLPPARLPPARLPPARHAVHGANRPSCPLAPFAARRRKAQAVGLGAVLKRLESLERRLEPQSPGGTVHAVVRASSANAAPYARNGGGGGGAADKKHHRKGRGSEPSMARHHRRKPTGSSDRLQAEPTVTILRT